MTLAPPVRLVHGPQRAAGIAGFAVLAFGAAAYALWISLAPRLEVGPDLEFGWVAAAAAFPSLVVSALLCARLPGAAVTRVVTLVTLAHLTTLAGPVLAGWLEATDRPGAAVAQWTADVAWAGTLPLLPVLLLVFPDGWPRSGQWRTVGAVQLVALGAVVAATVAAASHADPRSPVRAITVIGGLVLLGTGVARAGALLAEWRRSAGDRRSQLGWFAAAAGLLAGLYLVGGALVLLGVHEVDPALEPLVYALQVGALPAALGVAVVRHRLYGLDLVVNRALVWSCLTVVLLGLYGASAALATTLLGGSGQLAVSSLIAATVVGLALVPVHRLAQTVVDRLMYGERDRPDRALRGLTRRLSETLDVSEVPQRVVTAVADALRLPFVAIERGTSAGLVRAAQRGLEPGQHDVVAIPIDHAGESLGRLLVAPRRGESALSPADERLLTELAAQAGVALYAGRLADDLADSRERLVQGRLDERARLRRALHEGLSPSLSGIALATAAARARLRADPDAAERLLRSIEEEASLGAQTVQTLLEGLRPPGLDEVGLEAAVEQRAHHVSEYSGVAVTVQTDGPLPAVSPQVEEAAYLIVVEALANVARHAGAGRCVVRLSGTGDAFTVEVTDDGMGFYPQQADGVGLSAARERAAAVGGTLVTASSPGHGFALTAHLPGLPAR